MARFTISLTPPNNAWLLERIESREYTSKSEVINDLIRKARAAEDEIRSRQAEVITTSEKAAILNRNAALGEEELVQTRRLAKVVKHQI